MRSYNTSINLKELSYLTGFSVSTVSKALNDKLDISTKTKRIITDVAAKHNYIPNSFAVGLRNKKSNTVAIILPQINTDFYSNLLFYFERIATRQDFRIVVFQSFKKEVKEMDYLKSICDGSVDGAIVITNTEHNLYSKNYSIPVTSVLIDGFCAQKELDVYCSKIFDKLLVKIT